MNEIGFGAAKAAEKKTAEKESEDEKAEHLKTKLEKLLDDSGCPDWAAWCMLGCVALGIGCVAFFCGVSYGRQELIDEIKASNLTITFSTQHGRDSARSWIEVVPSVD